MAGRPLPHPPWTISLETLIHDFDTLSYLNPGAEPVEVFAMADALLRPDFKDQGLAVYGYTDACFVGMNEIRSIWQR